MRSWANTLRVIGEYMNNNATSQIQKHLDPNEKILWTGQPKQGVMLRGYDVFIIPFSLLWGGFIVFWEYTVITQGAPAFFSIFGLPFVALGLYFVFGRFYAEAKQREKTYYAVTSERVLIISGLFKQSIKSLALRSLSDVSLTEARDNTGLITFGNSLPLAAWFGGMSLLGMDQFTGARLDAIENPKQVYQLIREAQRHAT